MKTHFVAAILIAVTGPALAQASHDQHHPRGASVAQAPSTPPAHAQTPTPQPGARMPMGQMMQGQGMTGSMMNGPGRDMMGRFSPEDMSAFLDAHVAALHVGLKLTDDQKKLWPPVESAIRDLATLHLGHMQTMRQARGMMASDPVGLLRGMADHMSQGADAMRKLADAAAPLYAALDEAQKRRLHALVRMGSRGMMGRGMMRPGMMGSGGATTDDDDDDGSR